MSNVTIARPKWMDNEFLEACIRNYENLKSDSQVIIDHVSLSYVVPKGENFMSIIYRATLQYRVAGAADKSEISLVIKSIPEDDKLAKMVPAMFAREKDMYTNVIPKLEKILAEKNLDAELICRYIHGMEKPLVIVLDDLKPLGFVVQDRTKGVDLEHSKLVYSRIAQFHAASMCYFDAQTEEVRHEYSKNPMEQDEHANEQRTLMTKFRIESNLQEFSSCGEKYSKSIKYFKKELENMGKYYLRSSYVPGNKFNSLLHSDFWINNVMFSYDKDGHVDGVVLVDLQACFYDSVARDFLFFFFTSTTLEVRHTKFEELKRYYFDALVGTLRTLDYKGQIPTLRQFEDELKRCVDAANLALNFMLPMILINLKEDEKSRENSKAFGMDDIVRISGGSGASDTNYLASLLAGLDVLQECGCFDQ